MALGALLLFATLVTWATGLMMSPHGQTVVQGTEHVRTTVVTFKRNAAIGTLICCALAALLLFPRQRPKWPARDWAVAALIAFLGMSSVYTLVRLPPSEEGSVSASELANSGMNAEVNAGEPAAALGNENFNPPPAVGVNQLPLPSPLPSAVVVPKGRSRSSVQEQSVDSATEESAATPQNRAAADTSEPVQDSPANNQE